GAAEAGWGLGGAHVDRADDPAAGRQFLPDLEGGMVSAAAWAGGSVGGLVLGLGFRRLVHADGSFVGHAPGPFARSRGSSLFRRYRYIPLYGAPWGYLRVPTAGCRPTFRSWVRSRSDTCTCGSPTRWRRRSAPAGYRTAPGCRTSGTWGRSTAWRRGRRGGRCRSCGIAAWW